MVESIYCYISRDSAMKKVLFLVNPVSGGVGGRRIKERILSELQGMLPRNQYSVEDTKVDCAQQARDACPEYETVVAIGGDGTLHQVVQGIADVEQRPKVGIIPIGTGNDLAASLGIVDFFKSYGLHALLELILKGKTIPLDVITLNGTYVFTNYFGMGNDAKISNDFNKLRLTRFFPKESSVSINKIFYSILGLGGGFYRIPFDIELRYRKEQCLTETMKVPRGVNEVLITNLKSYAGGACVSSKSSMDDGKFEVTIITNAWQWLVLHLTRFLKRPLDNCYPKLVQFQTDVLEIAFQGTTFYQIDGEVLGGLPEGRKHLIFQTALPLAMVVP